jgi:hypothetical protein
MLWLAMGYVAALGTGMQSEARAAVMDSKSSRSPNHVIEQRDSCKSTIHLAPIFVSTQCHVPWANALRCLPDDHTLRFWRFEGFVVPHQRPLHAAVAHLTLNLSRTEPSKRIYRFVV